MAGLEPLAADGAFEVGVDGVEGAAVALANQEGLAGIAIALPDDAWAAMLKW